jgi:GTP-binding protein
MQQKNNKIRNIAIIAHVDHGKTTLVDAMLKQSGLFRDNQVVTERLMDNMELERERGITIAAKNCSIKWKGVKINILDTPGHSDFGGEVERALSMVEGVILLVDASEGPLPQTRFVLEKALKNKLKLIVVINKIDRQDARPKEVLDEIYDLLIDLDATEDQLDFPLAYAVGKDGIAVKSLNEKSDNLHILLDMILDSIPGPTYEENKPFQMLVSDLSYSDYLGRLAIGKIINGSTESKNNLVCINEDNILIPLKISKLQVYNGVSITEANRVEAGDIIILSGINDVKIGDTITTEENPESLPRIIVDEPTVFMEFSVNTSPYAGRDGQFVQSKKIKERLYNESLKNVSIKVEEAANSEKYIVKGRGEFQLAILIEMMRREGFELSVSRPQVIFRNINGVKCEPIEYLLINCPEEYSGIVTEKLLRKKGTLINMINKSNGRVRLEFNVPSRALIGYKDEFLTDTHGTGIMNSSFIGYEKYRGDFPARFSGSLVSDRQGKAVAYALGNLEARGKLFIKPGDDVYEGMIIGEYSRDNDLNVNPCKTKKLTNLRAAGKDDAIILAPPIQITLEKAIQFIKEDEMIEITPKVIRLRKTILSAQQRKNN